MATMFTNRERLVTITAYYYTEPTVISVPAQYSLGETCEAIHSAVSKHPATQGALTLDPPFMSAITPSGEFVYHIRSPLTVQKFPES